MSGSHSAEQFGFGDIVQREDDDIVVMCVGISENGRLIQVQEQTSYGGHGHRVGDGGMIGLTLADPMGVSNPSHYPVGKSCWLTGMVRKIDE